MKNKNTVVLTKEDWLTIAREYGRNGVGGKELSNRMGVSKQRVFQVVQRLREEGIVIPQIRNSRIGEFVAFVKKTLCFPVNENPMARIM